MTEREFAIDVVRRLHGAGFQALWAGGCVRDELLGLLPKDYDIATDARPEQVQWLFRRTVGIGKEFGVVKVLGPRTDEGWLEVEVATFRSDVSYSDGRHPDRVVFSTAREDALRRDFTVNGMFFDPLQDGLIDYVGGQDDLRARVLRAIGDPVLRFREDKLRMLRAVRIATRFDLAIDPATADAIRAMAYEITRPPPEPAGVSAERIAEELRKLLVYPRRARGVRLLDELGLVEPILPELLEMKGVPQGPPSAPTGDLWDHVLRVLELLDQAVARGQWLVASKEEAAASSLATGHWPLATDAVSFPLALAALLHDVGKRRTMGRGPDRYTFRYHEHVGKRLTSEIGLRLKLSNAERERVEWLVERHQYLCDARQMRTSKLKPVLAHPGIGELLALHRTDALAAGKSTEHVEYCEALLREWSADDLNPEPLLTGHDLQRLGLKPGPRFKELLDAVREAQLDGTIKTAKEALELVERILKE